MKVKNYILIYKNYQFFQPSLQFDVLPASEETNDDDTVLPINFVDESTHEEIIDITELTTTIPTNFVDESTSEETIDKETIDTTELTTTVPTNFVDIAHVTTELVDIESTETNFDDIETNFADIKPTESSLLGPFSVLRIQNATCQKKQKPFDVFDHFIRKFRKNDAKNERMEIFFKRWLDITNDYSFIDDEASWPKEPTLEEKNSIKTTVLITVSVLALVLLMTAGFFSWYCCYYKRQTRDQDEEFDMGQYFQDDDTILCPPPPSPALPSTVQRPPSPLGEVTSISGLVNLIEEFNVLQEAIHNIDRLDGLSTSSSTHDEDHDENQVQAVQEFDLRPLGLFVPTKEMVEVHTIPEDQEETENVQTMEETKTEVAQAVDKTEVAQAVDDKTEFDQAVDEAAQAGDDTTASDDETKNLEAVRPAKFKTAKTLFLRRLYQ